MRYKTLHGYWSIFYLVITNYKIIELQMFSDRIEV